MNDFSQALRSMAASGTSPDGNVRATINGERILEISFRPHSYEWYDEAGLERQLAGTAVSTWVSWTRERREISRLTSGLSRSEADRARRESEDHQPLGYVQALRSLECDGISSGHVVSIQTSGMTRWRIGIEDGVLRRFDARRFTGEIRSAFESLMRDRDAKITFLRADYFDIGVPREWRARAEGR